MAIASTSHVFKKRPSHASIAISIAVAITPFRRWHYARGHHPRANLCFVGLSATLTNAESFFSKLSNLPVHQVTYIKPEEEDMTREGVEYNIVLKGDPVSGSSLLSTSVQAVMLLGRMLDPK